MSSDVQNDFDPYYKWLGIPPGEQPPNHYRLLGVSLFEPDADVIDAADQNTVEPQPRVAFVGNELKRIRVSRHPTI